MRHTTCGTGQHHGRGPSSYAMHDAERVFDTLALKKGTVFLDMGCGPGDYAIHAARIIGESGTVHALDWNARTLAQVELQARANGMDNIHILRQDMTAPLPLADGSVDTCLLSTSLHCLDLATHGPGLLREIHRILAPEGCMAILECKKEETGFGPPQHMRISAEDVDNIAGPRGFACADCTDLGGTYLARFIKKRRDGASRPETRQSSNTGNTL